MQIVAFIFFLAALTLSLAVVAQMLFAHRDRILEALAGTVEPEFGPPADVIYLNLRTTPEVEWRRAA